MTLSEFKAWFEGYTEGLDGAPSEKQFKRIKAKVSEISEEPTEEADPGIDWSRRSTMSFGLTQSD